MRNLAAQRLLIPLQAGRGWEGVAHVGGRIQSEPHPNPPLLAGEGAQACRNRWDA